MQPFTLLDRLHSCTYQLLDSMLFIRKVNILPSKTNVLLRQKKRKTRGQPPKIEHPLPGQLHTVLYAFRECSSRDLQNTFSMCDSYASVDLSPLRVNGVETEPIAAIETNDS